MNNVTRILIIGLYLLPLGLAQAAIWQVDEVEPSQRFEDMSPQALVQTSAGLHLFYGGDHLHHATGSDDNWQSEVIDPADGVGRYAAAVADAQGGLHVAYYDSSHADLRYASNAGGQWQVETVDSAGDVGRHPAITLDSQGSAHISYFDGSHGQLRYASNASGSWVMETVTSETRVGRYSAISVASDGSVRIVYYDIGAGDLRLASNPGSGWASELIDGDGDVGQALALAVDGAGKLYISYFDATNEVLKLASGHTGSWSIETVDTDAGSYSAPGLDDDGVLHIAYHAWKQETLDPNLGTGQYTAYLRTADNGGGDWSIHNVASSTSERGLGRQTALAVSGSGLTLQLHLAYTGSGGDLAYADFGLHGLSLTPNWLTHVAVTAQQQGRAARLTLDSSDRPHVSYIDGVRQKLRYAVSDGSNWMAEDVDQADLAIRRTGIGVDASGVAHISYFGIGDWTLGSASVLGSAIHIADPLIPSSTWTLSTVDNSATVGRDSDLVLDNQGHAHIAYWNEEADSLWYATDASGSWVTQEVDDSGDAGQYPAIALDRDGHVHIAYLYHLVGWDAASSQLALRYASNASSSWIWETVDDTELVGAWPGIAVDSGGIVHISYYDQYNGNLKYASGAAGSWSREVVDSAGNIGQYSSLALDSQDAVHIAYYGWTTDTSRSFLRYANNVGGHWATQTINSGGRVGRYASIAVDSHDSPHIAYYDEANGTLCYAVAQALVATVSPAANDFGEVRQNTESVSLEISLRNDGVGALTVTAMTLSDPQHFTLNLNGGHRPCGSAMLTLALGEQCSITVAFTPAAAEDYNATLSIDFADPGLSDAIITLVGRGTAEPTSEGNGGGGCFIATAAYGSYLDSDVEVLRQFRDQYLLTNNLGRSMVTFYYEQSPPIANFIRKHEILRSLVRWILTPMVYTVKYPLPSGTFILLMLVIFHRRNSRHRGIEQLTIN